MLFIAKMSSKKAVSQMTKKALIIEMEQEIICKRDSGARVADLASEYRVN